MHGARCVLLPFLLVIGETVLILGGLLSIWWYSLISVSHGSCAYRGPCANAMVRYGSNFSHAINSAWMRARAQLLCNPMGRKSLEPKWVRSLNNRPQFGKVQVSMTNHACWDQERNHFALAALSWTLTKSSVEHLPPDAYS